MEWQEVGISAERIVTGRQVHGVEVAFHDGPNGGDARGRRTRDDAA